MSEIAPYGTWLSPVTTDALVSGAVGISDARPDGDSVYWSETRPGDGGRTAIVQYHQGVTHEITPPDANVRTTVHEYGGGSWTVDRGMVYYVDYQDQRLRSIGPQGQLRLLTPKGQGDLQQRFADFVVSADKHWLIAVCEAHSSTNTEAVNKLVAIACDGSKRIQTLVEGADFYSSPRLSADDTRLAWIEWQHPNMPWDNSLLQCASVTISEQNIKLHTIKPVAGGINESVMQPEFSPTGVLHYLSDQDNYWQLYNESANSSVAGSNNGRQPVQRVSGEVGVPAWVFGESRYAFKPDGKLVLAHYDGGIDTMSGFPQFSAFSAIRTCGDTTTFIASSWQSESVVVCNGEVISTPRDLAAEFNITADFLQPAEKLVFETDDQEQAYALFFPPLNPKFSGPATEKPPLIVLAHGGPTSCARSELRLARQFWTSRGFAVVDVNYRGSSGFGRQYRQKLNGQWGVADVADCVNAARYLADRGDVDPQRLIIRGGSAGGFTVLSALAFHDVFTAGASLYGVADLQALAADTHKFESRYLDNLVGPYPEQQVLYKARSPIHNLDGFSTPMIVLQGSEDAIVPPNQSRMIVEALKQRKVPVAYIEFAGEQHGFRQAETIKQALASELAFYGRMFKFSPADCDVELEIFNA